MTETVLPAALDPHTLLVAAVIVHDEVVGRVPLLQHGPRATFRRGCWDLPTGKAAKRAVPQSPTGSRRPLRPLTTLSVVPVPTSTGTTLRLVTDPI